MEELQKWEGCVTRVIYTSEDNGYAVFEMETADDYEEVSGIVGEVHVGETVTVYGRMVDHPTYGKQLKAEVCQLSAPRSVQDILAYLSSGALPYIGPATAKKIVKLFGERSLQVISETPEQLCAIKGISEDKAQTIGKAFQEMFGAREIIAWLAGYGISLAQALTVYNAWGGTALERIKADPYCLCGEPLSLKFSAADAIAGTLNITGDDGLRIRACLLYVLRHNCGNGHTCLPRKQLVEKSAQFIGVPAQTVDAVLERELQQETMRAYTIQDIPFVFLTEFYEAEQYVAWRIAQLSRRKIPYQQNLTAQIGAMEQMNGIQYAPAQRDAISGALNNSAFVLTGGPGTGKTTTVNAILSLLEFSGERVALCAPTGRAAKRLSELADHKALTIHRLLEVDYSGGEVRFLHNETNKLKFDAVIIDEMSMVDVRLFQSLLAALKPSCRVIMVGDADQLPSVGAGNVLSEILKSGIIPAIALKTIFRQAAQSLIVENAHRIVQGQMPQQGARTDDFFFMKAQGTDCRQLVCDLVCSRLPQSYGYDPIKDIQVLCPTKMGPVGTRQLNEFLQQRLNPPAPHKGELHLGERILRLGDKVMQVKNNYDIPYIRENGESGVGAYNGDIGIIVGADTENRILKVKMDDRELTYTSDHFSELEVAYAVTVHKSQGSEFPAVIMPVSDVPQRLCYRNLLYTGVTRAKKLCILAGTPAVLNQMVVNISHNLRFSGLAPMLVEQSQKKDGESAS